MILVKLSAVLNTNYPGDWKIGPLRGFRQQDGYSCGPYCWMLNLVNTVGIPAGDLVANTTQTIGRDFKVHVASWLCKHKDNFRPEPVITADKTDEVCGHTMRMHTPSA